VGIERPIGGCPPPARCNGWRIAPPGDAPWPLAVLLALCVVVTGLAFPGSAAARHHKTSLMKEHAWHQGKIPSFRDSFGHVYDKVGALHDVSCVRRVPNGKSYRCYAVGENAQTCTNLPCDEIGVIVYSDDGGKRWSFGNVGGGISILTGISCIGPGPGECVAVGNGVPDPGAPRTALIATMDASGRWNPSFQYNMPSDLRRVSCVPDSSTAGMRCWMVAMSSTRVYASSPPFGFSDASSHPLAEPGLPFVNSPLSVSFATPEHGFVVGGDQCGGPGVTECPGAIWHTADGGASWPLQFGGRPYDTAISCTTSSRCWVAAKTRSTGVVRHTSNGGHSWPKQSLPGFVGELNEISCDVRQLCWTIGDHHTHGIVLGTPDGGAHWDRQVLPKGAGPLIGVVALGGRQGLAVGYDPSRRFGQAFYTTSGG